MILEVNRAKREVIIKDQKHINSELVEIDNIIFTSMGWPGVAYLEDGRMFAIYCWSCDKSSHSSPLKFRTHDDLKRGLYCLQIYAIYYLHESFEIDEVKEGRTKLC